ncbi:hypothetical protein TWF481_008198 [Arthrobotrys musiformis]|uniref:Uncharacterized protein n=1 Tax=Arthrobotrys musiformis TaxID=47236 RepID=A0AAV9W7H6_9PEZI
MRRMDTKDDTSVSSEQTEFVPATPPPPPAVSTTSAPPPPVRPQDVPVLPATPLLDYATVGKAKSPLVKAATPVTPKVQPAVSEPKSKKKKDEKPQAPPTMAAVAKAPPPPPTPSKTPSKEQAGKKAKPPTLPPLAAVVAAATAEHSPTSARSPAAASPRVLKLPSINQSGDAGPSSATSSVPPTPQLTTAAPVPTTSRARTMRIVSSTPSVENKAKAEVKDKDSKVQDVPALTNTATRQVTRPATPASELISDTASTTSSKRGSISSPMVRSDSIASSTLAIAGKAKSKSALKKERQALAKKEEKEREKEKDNAPVPSPSPTVEDHAPVVARARKKEKKSKAAAAGKTVKTTALPASPGIPTPTGISPVVAAVAAATEAEHRDDRSSRAGSVSVVAPSEVHHEQASADSGNNDAENESNKPDLASTVNANDIITALDESREVDFMDLELLKPVVGLQHRFDISAAEIAEFGRRLSMVAASAGDVGDHQISVEITANPATMSSSASNSQSSKNASATTRLIVTPGGVMLKGLTAEQEAKFIRLEERASKTPIPFKSDLAKATFPVVKKEQLAETLASKAAGLADLSLEDTLAYLNQLNQFLEFSPETAAAAAAAASQLAQAHTQFTAGKFQPAPIQQGPTASSSSSKALPTPAPPGSKKSGKTPPSTAVGPPPAPINPASVASAAVAAAAGSLEQMLMVGFQSAFNNKPMSDCPMTSEEAEKMLVMSRKETEAYEKKLNNLVKRNKRLIFGALGLQV